MEEAFQRGWSITASNAAETELDEDTLLVLSLSSKKSVPPPRDGLVGFLMGSHTPLHLPCIVIIFFFFLNVHLPHCTPNSLRAGMVSFSLMTWSSMPCT